MILAIDATRNRSGGAVVHLVNILHYFDDKSSEITEIHLWSYEELLSKIPDYIWLRKHSPKAVNRNIAHQLKWQYFDLPKEIKANNCDMLFSVDAGSICRYDPYIVMSRDMLSFEKNEFNRYFFSLAWLRLWILKFVQLSSFKNSAATIFLTHYAQEKIRQFHSIDYDSVVINHGVSDDFRIHKKNKTKLVTEAEINITFVSNADLYKHHWNVIEAVHNVRCKSGLNVKLNLIGSEEGNKFALNKIDKAQDRFDPDRKFILRTPKMNHNKLIEYLRCTDIFLFASTCENMPNTLIEGMTTGLPIVCSNYGPMKEMIKDAAIFFDPEEIGSIEYALSRMIYDDELRLKCAEDSYENSKNYSWEKCSNETFEFIINKMNYAD